METRIKRKIRELTFDEMLALYPADSDTMNSAINKMLPIHSHYNGDPNRLRQLTESGELSAVTVTDSGEPAYVLWYKKLGDRCYIEMVCSLKSLGFDKMVAGFVLLAKSIGCKSVEGVTCSKALAEYYLKATGFEPIGVHFRWNF